MIPHIKKWEGGWSNRPTDKGGPTMMGVTLATFRQYFGAEKTIADLRNITEDQWMYIFKNKYWDWMQADKIQNQSVAELCVDMLWMSGQITAIKKIQAALGCTVDGVVGPKTLAAINRDSAYAFHALWTMRYDWLCRIAYGDNLNGWLNRLRDQHYKA